jgi:hypothetical protein
MGYLLPNPVLQAACTAAHEGMMVRWFILILINLAIVAILSSWIYMLT